eukprot:GDKJ01002949.1.p1 GENE.GDKJ01002949.1~~GDKJ01002949.1.p1  ORF type:complete len:180 (-),score=25.90 GDKJ01002949.1:51-590(-)
MGNHYFSPDRQASFQRKARKEVHKDNLKKHDEERKRMEEFRKLCKKEGIQSARLEQYDTMRQQASEHLDLKLQEIDNDTELRNAEKKKKKFALKRQMASKSIANMKPSNFANPVAKAMVATENKKEAIIRDREEEERRKKKARRERSQNNQLLIQKTRKGQPLMSGKIEFLLNKINKQK